MPIILFAVPAAHSTPVRFSGEEFIRIGSYKKKLKDYPEKERRLWDILSSTREDWSAQIVHGATLADLDHDALEFARLQYLEKHPRHVAELQTWDDETFLNKAKVCIGGWRQTKLYRSCFSRPRST